MKKLLISSLLLTALLATSSQAFAGWGWKKGWHGGHGGHFKKKVVCVAKNYRGYKFYGVSFNRYRAAKKAIRKCRFNSYAKRSCRIVYCKRKFGFYY